MSAVKCSNCQTCADICDAIPVGHTLTTTAKLSTVLASAHIAATSVFPFVRLLRARFRFTRKTSSTRNKSESVFSYHLKRAITMTQAHSESIIEILSVEAQEGKSKSRQGLHRFTCPSVIHCDTGEVKVGNVKMFKHAGNADVFKTPMPGRYHRSTNPRPHRANPANASPNSSP